MLQKHLKHLLALSVSTVLLAGGAVAAEQSAGKAENDFCLDKETFFRVNTNFKDGRKVFAWYMVCCGPYNGGWDKKTPVEEYKKQIRMAQSMGIDGFGLDIMRANDEYKLAISKMFTAAEELNSGFKLFFKFDYHFLGDEQVADLVALLKKYSGSKCYEHYQGKPLAGYYGADLNVNEDPVKSVGKWRDAVLPALRKEKLDIFYVPTTFMQARKGGTQQAVDESMKLWGDTAQGMSIWMIQTSPFGGGMDLLEKQSKALRKAGKAWMTTLSFHYWWGSSRSVPVEWLWMPGRAENPNAPTNGKYFEHGGGKGLEMQWKSIMEIQKPQWVMILTWNDYNESYIEPIDDYKKYPNGTASGAPLGWYKRMIGLDELNRYYIQWYKTGVQPTITRDSLFYCYRTHSQHLKAFGDNREPVRIGNGPIGDDIYLTTALTAPAQLRVVSGTKTSEFHVPAGIAQTVVPFQTGRQIFSLWRNSRKLIQTEGEPVVDKIQYYSYWPTTGFVTAK